MSGPSPSWAASAVAWPLQFRPCPLPNHVRRLAGVVTAPNAIGIGFGRAIGRASDDLAWHDTVVEGRRASYAAGGAGMPVLFLHGWGLGHRAYRRALRRLTARGCRVYAPALPGFGGTPDLPPRQRTIEGYATWVASFLEAVEVDEPAFVLGHSFGGGVAIRLAHDHPDTVRYLVLLNSVGTASGGVGMGPRPGQRPLWSWAMDFGRELLPSREGLDILRAASDDFTLNLLENPGAVWEVGNLARRADLTDELAELGRRRLPVLVLSSERDHVIPLSSFDALCGAVGADGRVVAGGHSWLLADPDAFGEVLGNVVHAQVAEHGSRRAAATADEVGTVLQGSSVPPAVAAALLEAASPQWLLSESAAVLAADLALCHPPLADEEVRAVARELGASNAIRLTVVAPDRPGLLADTAAVLAAEGLSVRSASAVTWDAEGLALHALTFDAPEEFDTARWDALGAGLRELGSGERPEVRFVPHGKASVTVSGDGANRSVVRVTAPDQLGLLWATCRWFADHGVPIEAANATTANGIARDVFVVDGACDGAALASHLTRAGRTARPRPAPAARVAVG